MDRMNFEDKLEQGIAAAEAGEKKRARRLLAEVVEADETQLEAWLWLSEIVDSLDEKLISLENILILDPNNEYAQEEIEAVRAQQAKHLGPTYTPGEEKPPPAVVRLPEAMKQPVTQAYPHQDEFDDPWLCPYCAKPTRPENQRCPHCKRPLVIRRRVKEARTEWLWRGIFLQISSMMVVVALGAAVFMVLVRQQGIPNPTSFLPLYLGQAVEGQSAQLSEVVLNTFPQWAFWGMVALLVYSFLMMLVLYFRVPHANTLYLISSSVSLVLGIFGAIFFFNSLLTLLISGFAIVLGLAQFVVTLNLWNDFTFKEHRINMQIDRHVKTHRNLYQTGREYARHHLWGLAMLHYRHAVAANAHNPAYRASLALAYLNIHRPDLAQQELEALRKIDSGSPAIAELQELLLKQKQS